MNLHTINIDDSEIKKSPFNWWPLAIFLFSALLINYVVLSKQSLFLDEFRTFHVIHGGFRAIFNRFSETPLISPFYYFFPWITSTCLGNSEFSLRLPSILFIAGATVFLFKIIRFYATPEMALTVCVLFVAEEQITFAGVMARPYGLAFLLTIASVWFLISYLSNGKWIPHISFLLSLILSVYAHPFSIFIVLIYPFVFYSLPNENKFSHLTKRPFWGGLILFISLLPLYFPIKTLMSYRQSYNWLAQPQWLEMVYVLSKPFPQIALLSVLGYISFLPPKEKFGNLKLVVAYVLCLWCLIMAHPLFCLLLLAHAYVFTRQTEKKAEKKEMLWLLSLLTLMGVFFYLRNSVLWIPWKTTSFNQQTFLFDFREIIFGAYRTPIILAALVAIILLSPKWPAPIRSKLLPLFIGWMGMPFLAAFFISRFSNMHIFLSRYYFVWATGSVGFLALVIMKTASSKLIKIFLGLACAASIVNTHYGWVPYTNQDWKGAVGFARTVADPEKSIVLLATEFTEAGHLEWLKEPNLKQHLASPLEFYPVDAPIDVLPLDLNKPEMNSYMAEVETRLNGKAKVILISSYLNNNLLGWIKEQMKVDNTHIKIYRFKNNSVVVYSR